AALGVGQMQHWDELIDNRRAVASRYDDLLAEAFSRQLLIRRPVATWAEESCWLYTLRTPQNGFQRDRLVDKLRAAGIDARRIWPALSNLSLYRPHTPERCPIAESVSNTTLWLPTFVGLTQTQQQFIVDAIMAHFSEEAAA